MMILRAFSTRLQFRTLATLLILAALFTVHSAQAGGGIATWSPVLVGSTGGHFPDGTIDTPFRIAVDPSDSETLYMATGEIPTPGEAPPPADGTWKSIDGGSTWNSVNEPSTGDPDLDFFEYTEDTTTLDIVVCPADSSIVAVATNPKGIFRSEDAGASWAWVSGGMVHTDAGPNHCGAIAHADQTFDTVGGRWTATTVAFDPTDCGHMYAGAADINAIDIGSGTGDHPGVFETVDSGATWTEFNDGLGKLVDALDCHSLTLKSKTVAPLSLKALSDGSVVLSTTEQHVDASIFSKTATSQLRVWSHPGSGSWTEVSTGLNAGKVTQTASFGELAAISVSAGFLSVSPVESFFVASHLGIATKILLSGDDITKNKSAGLFASLDLSGWIPRDSGIPVVNDAENVNAQNVGPVTIHPANHGLWMAGTNLSDAAGPDSSQVFAGPSFGANWVNSGTALDGLQNSPNGLFTESSVLFVEWDDAGSCLYATVLWDLANGSSTEDDGLYKICLF